ncbi:non-heme chloroperoxidase [Catenulispora sp. GAS73]|uniref:alpha/beta fold hydrolase n=1 Tax=Catenulispora sp. GAS73 TaxID=3156269 RepID=UPI00351352C3
MPYLKASDGTDLFFTDWPGDRPVVFVHAWGLNSCMWDYQIADLAGSGFRCITFDRRGHGRSDRPGVGYDLDTLADDLASVLETLDLSNVTLVAHSLGTCEAVRYLSRHGADRIDRLVLSGTLMPYLRKTADNPEGLDPSILDKGAELIKRDVGAFMDAYPGQYFDAEDSVSEELVNWTRRQIVETSMPILLATNGPFDLRNELPAIDTPTLILHGTDDISAPIDLTARRVAKILKNKRMVVFKGAGHGLYVSRSREYFAELSKFLDADISTLTNVDEEILI